jgi:hypothetical protein
MSGDGGVRVGDGTTVRGCLIRSRKGVRVGSGPSPSGEDIGCAVFASSPLQAMAANVNKPMPSSNPIARIALTP